jgi:hypothetical protein
LSLGAALAYHVLSLSQSTLSFLRRFLSPTTATGRKKMTGDELGARVKANGYQKGAHRDEDSLQNQNKHVDKVKSFTEKGNSLMYPIFRVEMLLQSAGLGEFDSAQQVWGSIKLLCCRLTLTVPFISIIGAFYVERC